MADTIFALSSGALPSGVAVVRVSGVDAFDIALRLTRQLPPVGQLALCTITSAVSGDVLDRAMVVAFKAPKSFTGEDVVEFHCHGSTAIISALVDEFSVQTNCRLAEAGEFSRRAFENGKLDLTEVEGLADLLSAETEHQRQLALRQSGGEMRRFYEDLRSRLVRCRALIEAELDFSDEEDVPGEISQTVWSDVSVLRRQIAERLDDERRGEIIRDGYKIVLAGPPNVGKSSLLNALARRDVAIVTEVAGTTRDVLTINLDIDGYKVVLSDTAGIRDSDDLVELEGMKRASAAVGSADLVLWLQELGQPVDRRCPDNAHIVWTKSDLSALDVSKELLTINTVLPDGLDALVTFFDDQLTKNVGGGEAPLITRVRHRKHLNASLNCLDDSLETGLVLELRAEQLRRAGDYLGQIVGRIDVEDLLDVIFSEFCVGK